MGAGAFGISRIETVCVDKPSPGLPAMLPVQGTPYHGFNRARHDGDMG
jgi:hypothetical protein